MSDFNSTNVYGTGDDQRPVLQRRLHRSRSERWVAGVLGGFAETYNINVTLLRVAFVASILLPGPQVIAYLAAWLIMPEGKQ